MSCPRESINSALARRDERKPLLVTISGTCVENVVVARDDVVLRGEPSATIVAADAGLDTVEIDGGRRIGLENLTLRGGRSGLSALRGASVTAVGCVLESNSTFGLTAAFNSNVFLDDCIIRNNGGGGAVASNTSNLIVTHSMVENNTGSGLIAARSSYLRVGQDAAGSPTPGPVTVRNNTAGGVVVTDNSAGNMIATTIEGNGGNGVGVQGGSNAHVGEGILGVTAPNTIRNNGNHGVSIFQASRALVRGTIIEDNPGIGVRVEGAAAVVIGNTIRRSGVYGVAGLNTASLRLGINDQGQGILSGPNATGNVIEDNVLEGLHLVGTSTAWMFGNTIRGNSTTNGRFGVLVIEQSVARMVGQNVVTANGSVVGTTVGGGVFLRDAGLHVLKGDFNITPNTNDISGNTGDGVQAIEGSLVELRDGVTITGNSRHGLLLLHGSRGRLQGTSVSGNAITGISLQLGGTLRLGPAPNTITDAIVCTPGETESSVAGAPVPPGCTGF